MTKTQAEDRENVSEYERGAECNLFFSPRQQRKWHLEASRHKSDGDLEPVYSVSYHVSVESRVLLVVRSVPIPAVASTFTANEAWQMMRWRLLMVADACRDVSQRENPSRSAVHCWQQQWCQLGLTSGKLLCQSLGTRSHARAVHLSYSKVRRVFPLHVTSGSVWWEPQEKKWNGQVCWCFCSLLILKLVNQVIIIMSRQDGSLWTHETVKQSLQSNRNPYA